MKPILHKIDGILLLDKPINMTSNGVLQRVKRLFAAKKAGHTGSLDPLATGMLPICFGNATKFSQYLLESDKEYEVEMLLGVKTTTADAEGEVVETRNADHITAANIVKVLPQFMGAILQVPPMYSAIKHKGKPLYELARKGIEIERQPRTVNIYALELLDLQNPFAKLVVRCSKGTYVRTLAEDIGEALGCGAHVSGLRRTAVKPYQPNKMITLAALEEMHQQQGASVLKDFLLPMESSVSYLPQVKLSASAAFYMRMGQPVLAPHLPTEGLVRVYSEEMAFMGIGEIMDDGRVAPRKSLSR